MGLGQLPFSVPKDVRPQTGASQDCLTWEATSELPEHLRVPDSLTTLVLSAPD